MKRRSEREGKREDMRELYEEGTGVEIKVSFPSLMSQWCSAKRSATWHPVWPMFRAEQRELDLQVKDLVIRKSR